jgi:CDGSH-type Zn-finger protein
MTASNNAKLQVSKDGPYLVSGNVPLIREEAVRGKDGIPFEWRKLAEYLEQENYALCRCGGTKDPPYCDGSHLAIRFDGTETAEHHSHHTDLELVEGAALDLNGIAAPCARAQFCQRGGGIRKLVMQSDKPDKRKLALEAACQCPAGRLVAYEKEDRTPIEPKLERIISVTEDPGRGVSGPLWVKGGLLIEGADGQPYERRNRVALCRCGHSKKMPLCDGTHVSIGFREKGREHEDSRS